MKAPLSGGACGVAAAALFGVSAPLAKLLLPGAGPLALAALLYLGAGASLLLVRLFRRAPALESPLRRADLPLLFGIALTGGVIGPVLMLVGLGRVSAVAGALILNLEAPLTILLAVTLFGEHLGRRAGLAALAIVGGSVLLVAAAGEWRAQLGGMAALAGACASWAVDNNLTQRLSGRDPLALVQWKTLSAGACTGLVALVVGHALPAPTQLGLALLLGAFSYGLSIVLDTYALRLLGAAREAALFATAPFFGALVALPLHHERLSWRTAGAAALMAAGVIALVRERHRHAHTHDALEHEHVHRHDDDHHDHPHPPGVDPAAPHSHPHRHAPLTHDHPHTPDLHHRHRH